MYTVGSEGCQVVRAQILKLFEPNFVINRTVISSFWPKGTMKSYWKAHDPRKLGLWLGNKEF